MGKEMTSPSMNNTDMNTPINDGGPAFPVPAETYPNGDYQWGTFGMSLRDWFAGRALTGILAHSTTCNDQAWKSDACAAGWSYSLADAMIAARNLKPTE